MPRNSSADQIINSARQPVHALQNPAPETPFEHVGDEDLQASKKIAQIFERKAAKNEKEDDTPPRVEDDTPLRVEDAPPRVEDGTSLRVKESATPSHCNENVKKRRKKLTQPLTTVLRNKLYNYRSPLRKSIAPTVTQDLKTTSYNLRSKTKIIPEGNTTKGNGKSSKQLLRKISTIRRNAENKRSNVSLSRLLRHPS